MGLEQGELAVVYFEPKQTCFISQSTIMFRELQLIVGCVVFAPLLRISALPLPPYRFPTKSHHPAAASNSEPEN